MTPMDETRYYRFDSGNAILRRTGDRVEKLDWNGVWNYRPYLMSYFMVGREDLEEISEQEARRIFEEWHR